MKPVKLTSVPNTKDDKAPRPMVSHDDHIYFSTDKGAHHGKVISIGNDGCRCEDEANEQHEVTWDKVLGHRKRADKKLVIVDKGEDGFIAKDESGKLVFVRGSVGDEEHPEETAPPATETKLQKAQVIAELAKAGFEPMMDYVRAEFGDNFVYRSGSEAQELRKSFDNLLATQNAQSQGLAAAISMLADKVASSEKLAKALINDLAEARKPKQAELPLSDQQS
jgi:hypothetical protein